MYIYYIYIYTIYIYTISMHVCYRCGAHAGATAYAHVAPKYMGNACLMRV